MKKAHDVRRVEFDGGRMVLDVDGTEHVVELASVSPRLLAASAESRLNFEVSASGYGIHWPDLDEDLSVDRLIGIGHDAPAFAGARSAAGQPETTTSD